MQSLLPVNLQILKNYLYLDQKYFAHSMLFCLYHVTDTKCHTIKSFYNKIVAMLMIPFQFIWMQNHNSPQLICLYRVTVTGRKVFAPREGQYFFYYFHFLHPVVSQQILLNYKSDFPNKQHYFLSVSVRFAFSV